MRLIRTGDDRVAWYCDEGDDALDAMVVELFGGWDGVTVTEAEPLPVG